jgi:hypothetical protein
MPNTSTDAPWKFYCLLCKTWFLVSTCPCLTASTNWRGTETFHSAGPSSPPQQESLNICAFSDPIKSPWLLKFLQSPFFNSTPQPQLYGIPNAVFDSLQLLFTPLLLSPTSPFARTLAQSPNERYDIGVVYNWNAPFSTLYTAVPHENWPRKPDGTLHPSFSDDERTYPWRWYTLDLYSVTHIRNFWNHKFLDPGISSLFGESSYTNMAKGLAMVGYTPSFWGGMLRDPETTLDGLVQRKWYGHYACVHPWPKRGGEFRDKMCCAEDYDVADPLVRSSFLFLFFLCPLCVCLYNLQQ